jgi:hypothetical protein
VDSTCRYKAMDGNEMTAGPAFTHLGAMQHDQKRLFAIQSVESGPAIRGGSVLHISTTRSGGPS